ncbi:MAG: ankyrin repeat domain-containing protein [Phenylobacterium sp.]|uniref:ankyrin repeat domain-containing protein n=1 Tax=Phenylobacterium sp. TaxID=1871053 RepID=UPI003016C285
MTSAAYLRGQVRAWRAESVRKVLVERPDLATLRDPRGRNWLHVTCMVEVSPPDRVVADSLATAGVLLDLGYGIDEPAFCEGDWRATALWHAVSRGRNLDLARFLLERGADPRFCLYAAAWNSDLEAIDILLAAGAPIDETSSEDGATPFLWAVATSHFDSAQRLLEAGADPDHRGRDGLTALHLMIRKSSPAKALATVIGFGARGDIPGPDGRTAIDLLARKRDPALRGLAETFSNMAPKSVPGVLLG